MAPNISIDKESKSLAPKVISFCTATKANPLNFASRWVWSYLVKTERARGRGAQIKEIVEWTGLGRQSVKTAVNNLIDVKLARKLSRYETAAIEPTGDLATWWAKRPPKEKDVISHWADSLGFFRVTILDGPILDSVLLGLLQSLAKKTKVAKSQCYLGLARMLGCKDYRTVKTALKALVDGSKIEVEGVRQNRYKKTDRFDVILKNAEDETATSSSDLVLVSEPPKPMTPIERIRHEKECMKRMLRNRNYPDHVIGTVLGLTVKLPLDRTFDIFLANLSSAEEDHQKQQSLGKYLNVKHSGNLLIYNLDKVIQKRKAAERNWARQMAGYEAMTACV